MSEPLLCLDVADRCFSFFVACSLERSLALLLVSATAVVVGAVELVSTNQPNNRVAWLGLCVSDQKKRTVRSGWL